MGRQQRLLWIGKVPASLLGPLAVIPEETSTANIELAGDLEDEALLPSKFGIGPLENNSYSKSGLIADPAGTDRHYKLFLHLVTCFSIILHLGASFHYLFFKGKLYANHFRDVLSFPWLVLIWFLEIVYFCGSVVSAVDNLLPPCNRADLQFDGLSYPTVDILLPCCKEPTDVPEESLRAALKLEYPSDRLRVLVLDDGSDDDLKAICETLQVETGGHVLYLRRPKVAGVPHNFKCGNLNYGLDHSDAEYVVMMDADMILHRSFLRRLLPHIVNSPNISFVQVPQSFYNLPVGDPLNDSCILGYEKMLVHRDSLGSATCVGTGALFRREHLDVIGGFQPQSITEDTTTAYALFKEGYRSVYLNEKLQIGLTPWTFEGYIKQRCRWGQGAIQQFKATWKEMLGMDSKLNLVLKMLYFWHSGFYFLYIANVILVATLLSALVFRQRLSVGSEEENRQLILNLASTLIFWRLSWFVLWLQVPQPVQSRNRDESHFWWMTPFYVKMLMESLFSYQSTFKFVPTSNIDRKAAKGDDDDHSVWMTEQLSQLKHVKFHLGYTFTILSLVIPKLYMASQYYGLENCRESFLIFGVSFFLLSTCAHMMLPVMHIVWPTNFKPSDRKGLLRYDSEGVPLFEPGDCYPKWHWSVLFYEALSYLTLAFWVFVVWMVNSGTDKRWCKGVGS